jgi:DNA-3-methyladenine glycosylase II
VYRRLFQSAAGPVLAELQQDGNSLHLSVTAPDGRLESPPASVVAAAAMTLTRTLGLDDDMGAFRAAAERDHRLAALAEEFAGLRLVSTPTAFEAFVWAVIGQQISLHVAFRLKAALVRRYGTEAVVNGERYWAFPEPDTLAAADPDEMAALGLGRRKSATIADVSAKVAGGVLDLEALAALPLDKAEAELVRLHGVGPWTAQYTLLRGLRVFDACPVSDGGLMAACGSLYGLGRKATVAEVTAFSDRWKPFRGLAAFHLWFMHGAAAGRKSDA